MDMPKTIPKRRSNSNELDFNNLKKNGIAALQEICGKTWTDYNLHDPGITILEQLCYALTELNYRAEFPMTDLLAGNDGKIDFNHQALYQPQDILPSQPVTLNDYRKLIIDRVPGIDNIWFETERMPGSRSAGLYWAYVRLRDPISNSAQYETNWILQRIRQVYADNRNLCEDLQEIKVIAQQHYSLQGRIELDGTRPPGVVLADIYFRCARFVAQAIEYIPYEEMLEKGLPLEHLLDGPLTVHGYIDSSQLNRSNQAISIVDIIGIVRQIDGVKHVDQLSFLDEKGQHTSNLGAGNLHDAMPYLIFPKSEQEIGVHLYRNGHKFPLVYRTLRFELDRLDAELLSIRRSETDLSNLNDLPSGNSQHMGSYYSIQHQFPDVYGINTHGIPASASPARKAQARQLKTYLLFFEQILANGLEQIQQAGRLVSVDDGLQQSYFTQPLENSNIPDIDELYTVSQARRNDAIAQVLATQDKYEDRRNRILDYLLGLYAEEFTQHTLRHLGEFAGDGKEQSDLIHNKLRYLKNFRKLSGHRAGACNYLKVADCEENHTTLIRKLSILLGLENTCGGSTTGGIREKGLMMVDDGVWESAVGQMAEADIHRRLFPIPPGESIDIEESQLFTDIGFLKTGLIDRATFHFGVDLNNYRMLSANDGQPYRILLLRTNENGFWHPIKYCTSSKEAIHLAYALRDFLAQLNEKCDRITLLEHILLRPRTGNPYRINVDNSFYAFRLSIILPAWTRRCGDQKFRYLAEESVALNCPSHLQPYIHWLDYQPMLEFENLYTTWREKLINPDTSTQTIDAASENLVSFMQSNGIGGL